MKKAIGIFSALATIVLNAGSATQFYNNQKTIEYGPAQAGLRHPLERTGVHAANHEARPLILRGTSAKSDSNTWFSYPLCWGEMTSIAMDPANMQVVYVGTRDAGVFKTTDGGQTWSPSRDGLSFFPIRSLRIDPQNADVLYAGTDNDGIWKSINGGGSWSRSSNGMYEGLCVQNILINPASTNVVYAALGGGIGFGCGSIYRTTDGGATWQRKDSGIPPYGSFTAGAILTLAMEPGPGTTIYAGTIDNGVYRSTNSGDSWTAINDSFPEGEATNALAVDPHHACRLGAIIRGTYYIYDNGSWSQIGYVYQTNGSLFTDYLYYSALDTAIIYSAGTEYTRSLDGGRNWTQHLGWNQSSEIADIAFNPFHPDTMFAASNILFQYDGGVYKSTNQGTSWTRSFQGITAGVIRSVSVDRQNPQNIYAGGIDGHFYRTSNGGNAWEHVYVGGSDVRHIKVDPLNPQRIFLCDGMYLRISTNQGQSFGIISGVEDPICITLPAVASNPIYAGTEFGHGIYKSTDGGSNWIQVNNGLPYDSIFGYKTILSLEIDPNDTAVVWAGMQHQGGIAKTIDGGQQWIVKGLASELEVDAIAINPANSNEVLVGAGYGNGNIYKTTDGGSTWQVKASGIAFVMDIEYDPRDPQLAYAGTEGYGVLRSFDGGETWQDYGAGIFYPLVYSIDITHEPAPKLIAGSYGSGLYWSFPSSQSGIAGPGARASDMAEILRVQPNPFRLGTSLEFTLSKQDMVRISVYNALGQRAETLMDGRLPAGKHAVRWIPDRTLASGMYMARLQIGERSQTERMLLVR